MLTINAGVHPLMSQFLKPNDEKRMAAVLPVSRYQDWLEARASISEFMMPFAADALKVVQAQEVARNLF